MELWEGIAEAEFEISRGMTGGGIVVIVVVVVVVAADMLG